ncbi:helix-turn-helix transcriptional regulator [Streptomyces sp. AM 4-1-1]|uniref:helix-turn-helix domain-containing protein n=1 Tax=Streptomyces sp. AM 4-1-1 TaxID=3028710 RepID=UPI0023B89D0B|nr:helix-turn-helix transcriptional regulator [Streptomyces sp. AM 4-1-1]WEH32188.1 helix-turn-helix transcriptional regulator [Streptomyces sp. AM 4-1-1]
MSADTAPVPPDARTSEPWREFGVRLRQWRRRAGLTQAQVGARVGYDHTAISRLEHGSRKAPPRLARRLDDLLTAGGELLAACEAADTAGRTGPAEPDPAPRPPAAVAPRPLPGEPEGDASLFALPPGVTLPTSLPAYGLRCPVHGDNGCSVPRLTDAVALHSAFCALGPATTSSPALDDDTVHALTALLAACLRADEERVWPDAAALVERTLHAITRWMAVPSMPYHRRLAPLAAEYAQSAGCLRLFWGRNGTAMAWLDTSLGWAAMAGDAGVEVAALGDMSTLARLEGDGPSALAYARAMGRAAEGRYWAGALSELYQARGHAVRGDAPATLSHIDRARSLTDLADERDGTRAPWLSVASLRLRVESGAAGALRDIAAAIGDRRLALRAVESGRTALSLLAPGMHASRALFTIRMADSYACAGDPQAALAVAEPVLAVATAGESTLLGQEVRGLRLRLAPRWAGRAETADLARRTGAGVRRPAAARDA